MIRSSHVCNLGGDEAYSGCPLRSKAAALLAIFVRQLHVMTHGLAESNLCVKYLLTQAEHNGITQGCAGSIKLAFDLISEDALRTANGVFPRKIYCCIVSQSQILSPYVLL